jgi:hypothetical protein
MALPHSCTRANTRGRLFRSLALTPVASLIQQEDTRHILLSQRSGFTIPSLMEYVHHVKGGVSPEPQLFIQAVARRVPVVGIEHHMSTLRQQQRDHVRDHPRSVASPPVLGRCVHLSISTRSKALACVYT